MLVAALMAGGALAPSSAAAADEAEASKLPEWLRPLRVRGRIAEESAYRLHDPGDVSKLRTVGWLDGKYTFSEQVSLRAATRGWYDAVFHATDRYPANVEKDQKISLSLREVVLSVSWHELDVRVGRQQVVWGDAISAFVTDVVNPRDLREFILQDFTELRIPIWALNATYRLREGLTLEVVWSPDTRSHTLPKQGAEFQFARPPLRVRNAVVRLPDDHDEFSLTRSEGGLRLSALLSGWDLSLIYYDTADKGPVVFQRRAPRPPAPDVLVLEPRHPRLHIVGATLGKSLGPVVLHAEAAYTLGKRYETADPLDPDGVVRRDTLDWLIAADYSFFAHLDTTVQISQKVLMGPATNLDRGAVEARITTSVAVRLTTSFFDNALTPSLLFAVNTNLGDFRLSPRLDYALTSAVTVSVGADILEGGKRTLYGQFDRNDRVWATTTWRF